jgi:hypothetical protein
MGPSYAFVFSLICSLCLGPVLTLQGTSPLLKVYPWLILQALVWSFFSKRVSPFWHVPCELSLGIALWLIPLTALGALAPGFWGNLLDLGSLVILPLSLVLGIGSMLCLMVQPKVPPKERITRGLMALIVLLLLALSLKRDDPPKPLLPSPPLRVEQPHPPISLEGTYFTKGFSVESHDDHWDFTKAHWDHPQSHHMLLAGYVFTFHHGQWSSPSSHKKDHREDLELQLFFHTKDPKAPAPWSVIAIDVTPGSSKTIKTLNDLLPEDHRHIRYKQQETIWNVMKDPIKIQKTYIERIKKESLHLPLRNEPIEWGIKFQLKHEKQRMKPRK